MPLRLIKPREGKTPYYAVRGTYIGIWVDRSTKTSKRAVAAKILRKIERDIESNSYAVKEEPTFASAATSYMNAGGERIYLKKLLEYFGDRPLKEFGQAEIDGAAYHLYGSRSPATRNRAVYTPISAVLRHAGVRVDLKRPKGSAGNRTAAWLWPEQAEAIFTEAEKIDPEFAALLIVLCYTGLRLSEALNLTWENVRLADGYAYVADTKNGEPRPVFIPPVVVAAAANLRSGETARLFRFRKGGHLYSLLRVAAFRAGVDLPERSAFHIFRHTYATWMRRYAGADEKALMATGAWKDRKSVDRYTHAIVSEESKLAALLPTPTRRISGK
jgi:integrase